MASDTGPANAGLFETLQPSPYKISSTNHSAYILLPALIFLAIAAVVVFVKVYTAWSVFKKLRMDDYAALAALGFYLARTVTVCLSVRHGLGLAADRLTDTQMRRLSQLYLASDVLLYPTLACAKGAAALLVILIQTLHSLWMFWVICGIVAAWMIAAICVIPAQCRPMPWAMGPTDTSTCIDQYGMQTGLRVVDILTDVALAVLPGILFMKLQMHRSKRLLVALLFGLRIVTPIFTGFAIASQRAFYDAPTNDRPFRAAEVSLWTSIAAGTSLITACLPSIRRFIADWAAGVSNTIIGDGDIALSAFNHSSSRNKSRTLRPDRSANSTWVQGGTQERGGKDEDEDSMKGLTSHITQTVDFSVQSERVGGDEPGHGSSRSRGSSETSLVAPVSTTSRSTRFQRPERSTRQRLM